MQKRRGSRFRRKRRDDVLCREWAEDVLIAWKNEAFLFLRDYPGKFEIVVPSVSILCQPTVAVVDAVAKKHGTEDVAQEYLQTLYSPAAQRLIA